MKLKLLPILLLSASIKVSAQQKPKPDSAQYRLTESQAILMSNILNAADVIAGNSATVSTAQYRELHAQILKLDSVIRIQYLYYHKPKEQPKTKQP